MQCLEWELFSAARCIKTYLHSARMYQQRLNNLMLFKLIHWLLMPLERMWEQGLFLPKFIKFYDYRNLGTCRKQMIFLTMSIQEVNKSLVLINLVGSQHKTQQLVDVANDFIVMITEHVFGIEFNLSDQLCPIIQLISITFVCLQTNLCNSIQLFKQASCVFCLCLCCKSQEIHFSGVLWEQLLDS